MQYLTFKYEDFLKVANGILIGGSYSFKLKIEPLLKNTASPVTVECAVGE